MAVQDLTSGSVGKTLIKYAAPMVATSLCQSLYSIIDMVIVGNVSGDGGLSAINNSGLIVNLITQIAIGLTVGGNVLIGQYFGAKQTTDQEKTIGTLFTLSLISGVVCTVLLFALAEVLLRLLGAPALEQSVTYLRICSFGMPFVFGYNALSAVLRALGNSRQPMQFIIISSVCNVVFDLIFVAALHMDVAGAALGTIISQTISFAIALIFILRHREDYQFDRRYLLPDGKKAKLIFKYGLPIALQWTVASISWLAVAFLINKYDVAISAGNGVSNKIKEFCQLFITSLTSAGVTMAAQNLGACEYERGREVMKVTMKLTLITAAVMVLISEIFAPQLVSLFNQEPEVVKAAVTNLRIEIIAQFFYAGFMTYNVLATASGDTMFVMANSFLNCIVVRLVLAFVLEYFIGLNGIYIACMIAPLSSVPVGYAYYRSGKWRRNLTKQHA